MADDRSGRTATGRGRRSVRGRRRALPALAGFALAATVGGVVGGLVVKTTWTSDSGSSGSEAVGEQNGTAACRAANVADEALPVGGDRRAGSGPGGQGRAWWSDRAATS